MSRYSDLPAAYAAAVKANGGRCPIEAGALGYLADHECQHGNLPTHRHPYHACGTGVGETWRPCWPASAAAWEAALAKLADLGEERRARRAPADAWAEAA
jgi:hypothetical protein